MWTFPKWAHIFTLFAHFLLQLQICWCINSLIINDVVVYKTLPVHKNGINMHGTLVKKDVNPAVLNVTTNNKSIINMF